MRRSPTSDADVHVGVLLVRLVTTTTYDVMMQRPMATLRLHHSGRTSEVRRTGVRERWGCDSATVQHGTVAWDLSFSFVVEIPVSEEDRETELRKRMLEVRPAALPASDQSRRLCKHDDHCVTMCMSKAVTFNLVAQPRRDLTACTHPNRM